MIGVLVSGEGRTSRRCSTPGCRSWPSRSNKPGVRALERAEPAGTDGLRLADFRTRKPRDAAMAGTGSKRRAASSSSSPATCICSREPFFDYYGGAVVNTHSAPLPDFPGAHPIEDVLAAGVEETAATVHYVDEGVDTGPVIAPSAFPSSPNDTVDTLRERVQAVEHRLLPEVVRELCAR